MRLKLTSLLTLLSAFVMQFAFAQEMTISGVITDGMDMPLPGANVMIKGTTTGTQTDFDGNYTLTAAVGDVLVFSYIGQKTEERTVGSQSVINVQLVEDAQALEEVVVVAYGAQKKESIVGSVAQIGSETIEQQQVTTVTQAIQGSVPGVNILTAGGVPGTNPTIRIRGISSINASADPLIIVDGAPYNGNLNSISQDQIKSISVLKDASSTALYGSRGANGVILITTKGGRKNMAPELNLTTISGISNNAVDFHKTIGSEDFMKYAWEGLRNGYIAGGDDATTAAAAASANLISELGYNPYGVNQPVDVNGNIIDGASLIWDTDWKDALLRDYGSRTEHGLNVSGGSENTTYFASVNYLNQQGNVKTTRFERVTSRLRVDTDVNDWLKIGANLGFTTSNQNIPEQEGSSFNNAVQWFYSVPNIYPLYRRDANGELIYDGSGNLIYDYGNNSQPVNGNRPIFSGENGAGALYNYDFKFARYNTDLAGYAQIKFTDYLKFKTNLSYQAYLFDSYSYIDDEYGYAANVKGRVSQQRNLTTTMNAIQTLNFNKSFGLHNLNADLIYEAYQFKLDALSAQGVGFLPNVGALDGSTTPESVGGSVTRETLNSILGRVAYNYNDKYYVEGSYRRDGSSRFAEDVRFGDFFSVGGSWVLSREDFLMDVDFISFLKLKASYGELGNNRGIGYFPYLNVFETGWNQLGNTGVIQGGIADPNLTWEKTASLNYGVEYGLFNGRLSGSFEVYDKESVDLIFGKPLPPSTGNTSILTNIGALRNYGIEFSVNGTMIDTADFTWSAGLNFSMDNNEITELTQDFLIQGTKRWEVGRSLYDFYLQEWAGVDPEDGAPMWYKDILDPATGEPTGERETTKLYGEATRYYQDKLSLPDIIGGFNTGLSYKNWDMNALFNFSFGAYVYDATYQSLMGGFSTIADQAHADIADRWQQPGDVTDVPRLEANYQDLNASSTRFLFANDYVRLRSLNIGYTLNQELTETIGLSNVRFYFQGDNLFTWQSHDGIDPEQDLNGVTDSRSYQLRTMSVGINAKF
ncbi:SusC/RagA family TonB-linked outer membrane protein [Robertkochia sediminum]|uniref:SusC/RagA family TonB-linked outer membrane protein n=1 Tax=Robertkochia sediminum TaxID=2785326 RepID=UPI001934AD54|nr:TonB-dependent receptor [Robertkochia sediminum]MBL7472870.1 TonB-dependent receptor [Robertkochia sediminum]